MSTDSTVKFRRAYKFLLEKEEKNLSFELEDLQTPTGWSLPTIKTYRSKKFSSFLKKEGRYFKVEGIINFSEDEFVRYMSQTQRRYQDPSKPELTDKVESLVLKTRESALLALDIYNRPNTKFKSEGFIVMIIIAWTALLHAIFTKRGADFYHKDKDGNCTIVDGDIKAWELKECLKNFFDNNDPVRKNLEFLITLRNKIEHRYLPSLDASIAGECQAAILNLDELLNHEFTNYYSLKDELAFPLQTTNVRDDQQYSVLKKVQGKQFEKVREFIDAYREGVPDKVYSDPKYSFRVYLIPKLGNHKKSSDVAMEFVKYDRNNPDDMEKYKRQVTLIKEKRVEVTNAGKLKPKQVIAAVSSKIEMLFNSYTHSQAWKFYNVRPIAKKADGCNTKFCQFDEAHKDFVYTQEWVEFLVEKLSRPSEFENVKNFKSNA